MWKRSVVATIAVVIGLAIMGPARAEDPQQVVVGSVVLRDGLRVSLEAVAPADTAGGSLWLVRGSADSMLRVQLDCAVVDRYAWPYALIGQGPAYYIRASGTAADGSRYYLTIIDYVQPFGSDLLAVRTEPGPDACGSNLRGLQSVADGDFLVIPRPVKG